MRLWRRTWRRKFSSAFTSRGNATNLGSFTTWLYRIATNLALNAIRDRKDEVSGVTHPLALASVVAPPVRVFFSIRLVRSLFRRGNLRRFLLAAAVMVLNGAAIVYLAERHALTPPSIPCRTCCGGRRRR